MRYAVDNEVIPRGIVVTDAVELEVLRDDVTFPAFIDSFDYCLGKGFFPAYQNSHTLHVYLPILSAKIKENTGRGVACQTSPRLQFGSPYCLPGIQGEPLLLFRLLFALIALSTLAIVFSVPGAHQVAAAAQEPTPPTPRRQENVKPPDTPKQSETKPPSDVKFTPEQIAESVILVYGSRPGLEHIRRYGVERGKITRYNAEGNPEEMSYERRFVRGDNLEKDKIRLDQKLPTMEYSLIYDDGKLWGIINGAAFTPRQDATADFISQHHHSIDSLLRYKECGSTITLVGKDQQKGLELYVLDLVDKENRKTRYYISARSLRVLWLEYEDGPPGGVAVKYTRKFLDYRIVQQTLAPYRTVLSVDGRQAQETQVLTITYGVKVSDSIFKNPEA